MGSKQGVTISGTVAIRFRLQSTCETFQKNVPLQKASLAQIGEFVSAKVESVTCSLCAEKQLTRRLREDGRKLAAANTETSCTFKVVLKAGEIYSATAITKFLKDENRIINGVKEASKAYGPEMDAVAGKITAITSVTYTDVASSLQLAMGALLLICLQGLL